MAHSGAFEHQRRQADANIARAATWIRTASFILSPWEWNWKTWNFARAESTDGIHILGNAMFNDPMWWEPTDAKGHSMIRTVVHESFHAFGADPDVVYWGGPCRLLAKNRPGDALKNADSYQLYTRDVYYDGLELEP